MLARELMSDIVPFLRTSDTGAKALTLMEIFRISHLPIVNDKELLGLISDTDIYDMNMSDQPIGNHKLSLYSPFVYQHQHIYEVIEIVSRQKLSVIPVLDERKQCIGLITLHDLLHKFANLAAVQNPGAIIVLDLNQNDYYLSQIAQIIEGNDAKILSLYLNPITDSTRLEVTIKINKTEISAIVQTFERYEYNIKATYLDRNEFDTVYENRFEEFMLYLNM